MYSRFTYIWVVLGVNVGTVYTPYIERLAPGYKNPSFFQNVRDNSFFHGLEIGVIRKTTGSTWDDPPSSFYWAPIVLETLHYCWWKKSCSSWYGKYPIIYMVLYIPGDAGFLPSTVSLPHRALISLLLQHPNWVLYEVPQGLEVNDQPQLVNAEFLNNHQQYDKKTLFPMPFLEEIGLDNLCCNFNMGIQLVSRIFIRVYFKFHLPGNSAADLFGDCENATFLERLNDLQRSGKGHGLNHMVGWIILA